MATLQELFSYQNEPTLKERVFAACWRQAKAIFQELESTANHAERLRWAIQVLRARDAEGQQVIEAVRGIVTVKDTSFLSDAEIETTLSNIVTALAVGGQ